MSTQPRRRALLVGVPLALVSLLTTAAGCGSSSGTGSGGSGGGGKSALNCTFTTYLNPPIGRQITATSSVVCDFPVDTSKTSLVIQGRKTGSGNTAWDNFDDPKTTTTVPNQLTYTVTCLGGYDYQASAAITGVSANGQPFHADETTPVASYSAADCSQS